MRDFAGDNEDCGSYDAYGFVFKGAAHSEWFASSWFRLKIRPKRVPSFDTPTYPVLTCAGWPMSPLAGRGETLGPLPRLHSLVFSGTTCRGNLSRICFKGCCP